MLPGPLPELGVDAVVEHEQLGGVDGSVVKTVKNVDNGEEGVEFFGSHPFSAIGNS